MKNKKLYIGLGVLAIAGIGYYIWKKNKSENKSNATGDLGGMSNKTANPCPKGQHLYKGKCYPNLDAATVTKSLYE